MIIIFFIRTIKNQMSDLNHNHVQCGVFPKKYKTLSK